jgi:hypothetical protein
MLRDDRLAQGEDEHIAEHGHHGYEHQHEGDKIRVARYGNGPGGPHWISNLPNRSPMLAIVF